MFTSLRILGLVDPNRNIALSVQRGVMFCQVNQFSWRDAEAAANLKRTRMYGRPNHFLGAVACTLPSTCSRMHAATCDVVLLLWIFEMGSPAWVQVKSGAVVSSPQGSIAFQTLLDDRPRPGFGQKRAPLGNGNGGGAELRKYPQRFWEW